jgi:hypothetical protein
MSGKVDRNEKYMKKRPLKSPLASSAAETILLMTKQVEKQDVDHNLFTTRRNNSEMFLKSMKRGQSTEFMKVLNDKNQEIKKLQEDNNVLSLQLNELTGTVKKYHKMRSLLKEKDSMIESLKSGALNQENSGKKSRRSSKKKKKLRISSKVSFDCGVLNEQLTVRPASAAHKRLFKNSPVREEEKKNELPVELKKLLVLTEKTLKGWKKSFKKKNKV